MSEESQSANNMPIDGQHHNDPPCGDKELPTNLQHVTDAMLRIDYVPDNIDQEQAIAAVKELQPARVVRVNQAHTAEVRASLPENQMGVEMEEKDIPDEKHKRANTVDIESENRGWSKITGKKEKKRYKSGQDAAADKPEMYTVSDQFFMKGSGSNAEEEKIRASDYSGGLMVVDADTRINKAEVIGKLIEFGVRPYEDLSWDTQITALAKGGLLIKIDPADAKKWVGFLSLLPGNIRCHPPRSMTRKMKNSVILFGVDKSASLQELRDGLRPVPSFVERFKRGNVPMPIVRVEYPTEELAQEVISNGYAKFNDVVWLTAEAPEPRARTRFCRTCKKCKLDCTKKHCNDLRCGRCGLPHKTADCKKPDDKVSCLECKASDHLMFKCPVVLERIKAEIARKKEARRAKNKRQRMRRNARKKAEKADAGDAQPLNQSIVVSGKTYAQAVAPSEGHTEVKVQETPICKSSNQPMQVPSLLGLPREMIIKMTVESFIEAVLPNTDPEVLKRASKSMYEKVSSVLQGTIPVVQTEAKIEMNEAVAVNDPAIELNVIETTVPEPPVTPKSSKSKTKTPTKKYKQTKLTGTPDKTKAMDLDRTRDITTWTDEQINSSGFPKLTDLTIPVSEGWTVICGCGRLFNPKGRSEHILKCPKAEYALVSSGDRKSTQKVLNSLW